jgi:glycosyltransferase involved in cell wall biosynthesis
MRIALVYDCLFPNTIGGAERWYRNVAERLEGTHRVTYLTRRQWGGEGPGTDFETVAVAPGGGLYNASGHRRIDAPLRFGWGVFKHLLRHCDRYDAVHTASFPYFSVIGAWTALRLRRSKVPLIVDWHEFWGDEYWRSYLGPLRGRIGAAVQALCLRLADRNFTFSRMVEQRLRERGHVAPVVRLTGEYAGPDPVDAEDRGRGEGGPLVVFAGRHIPEKRVLSIPPAIAAARREVPDLRCAILGDGPETDALRESVESLGLGRAIEIRGRVDSSEVRAAIASATCLLNPSEREGYGVVIVEAAALGTPTIVVESPENAATELIEPGVNGFVAGSRDPEVLARLIATAVRDSNALRRSTLDWYEENREVLSFEHSMEAIEATYTASAAQDQAGPGSGASA